VLAGEAELCGGKARSEIRFLPSEIVKGGVSAWTFGRHSELENLSIISGGSFNGIRVEYPQGSYDPGSMKRLGLPQGGANFLLPFPDGGYRCASLSYRVRFPKGFDFVKGGKLPGLYGGSANSGGRIPNGRDGFSIRFLWKEGGVGAVYAYLPNSVTWGSALGVGRWSIKTDEWMNFQLILALNDPGKENGAIDVSVDGHSVYSDNSVVFRDVPELKVDGLFFSTFFGGNKADFATPVSTYIEFSDFVVSVYR
jgi:hypothetical protein